MHQSVEQCDVRAGLEPHVPGGVVRDGGPARIEHVEFDPLLGRLFHVGGGDGMVVLRIGADHENHIGVEDFLEGVRHSPASDGLRECRNGRRVAETRAVVYVVGTEYDTDQLLEEVGFLVGDLGRTEAGQGARSVRLLDFQQLPGRKVERLIPFGFPVYFADSVVPVRGPQRTPEFPVIREIRRKAVA